MSTAPAPDFTALKTRQQAAWGSGDYAVIGTTLQIVGEQLAELLDSMNRAAPGSLVVPSEYLEAVVTLR